MVYTTRGSANGVITQDSNDKARLNYKGYDWWEVGKERQEEIINQVRNQFEIVEYTPKGR